MTELLVGTKKGLFVFEGEPGGEFTQSARAFAGDPVDNAMRDPRSGRLIASVTSPFYGPKIFFADDAGGEWTQAEGVSLPKGEDAALARVWTIVAGEDDVLYAGADPGVLFESRDAGESWTINQGLWNEPSRPEWQPGGGGLCIHSIVPWPGEPDRLALGISAAGVWLTDDHGASWRRGNAGLIARYMPEEMQAVTNDLCVHAIKRAPADPERLFLQFHGGVYRSDDAGESWTDIAAGLPGDFAFPLAVDPADPDSAFVIPLTAETDRVTAGGQARVFKTSDGGASWTALTDGLPQQDAYLTILRHALGATGEGAQLELYFGTTSGQLFGTGDGGASWSQLAACLPTVHSVVAVS